MVKEIIRVVEDSDFIIWKWLLSQEELDKMIKDRFNFEVGCCSFMAIKGEHNGNWVGKNVGKILTKRYKEYIDLKQDVEDELMAENAICNKYMQKICFNINLETGKVCRRE